MQITKAFRFGQGAGDKSSQCRFIEALEHIDARAREQRVVQLKRRVFCSRTDKYQRAIFDIGEERVLLGLVEAVDFVDEENRTSSVLGRLLFSNLDCLPDLFHTG